MKRLVVGVTGGIASGKTTVMRLLAQKGIPGISSDDLAHDVIKKGKPAYRAIVRAFGSGVLDNDRQINRVKLALVVFSNPAQLKRLERMVHPQVIRELKRFIQRHHGVIAVDIPLLFEAKLTHLVDRILVVYCSRPQQLSRMLKRDKLSRSQALARLKAQWPLASKLKGADIVVRNTGNSSKLRREVKNALQSKLLTLS